LKIIEPTENKQKSDFDGFLGSLCHHSWRLGKSQHFHIHGLPTDTNVSNRNLLKSNMEPPKRGFEGEISGFLFLEPCSTASFEGVEANIYKSPISPKNALRMP